MIEEQTILAAERLRDDLTDLRSRLRMQHKKAAQPVRSDAFRKEAASLAEKWLVEIAPNREVAAAIGTHLADMNVQFQRLLTFSEHATMRVRYEAAIRIIFDDYAGKIIVPLKQARGHTIAAPPVARTESQSAFVAMSFAPEDAVVNDFVVEVLEALGIEVITGEKPRADTISGKVKGLIEAQSIFVGIFTRRDKIAGKKEWTTSAWVIDEKAYAVGRKPLILIKENGVSSIGGIQGDDYEYLPFSREALGTLAVKLIQLFEISSSGLKE